MYNSKFRLPERLNEGVSTTRTRDQMNRLMAEHKPVNLGYGYCDYMISNHFNNVLAEVAANKDSALTQYTRGFGHPRLVEALSAFYTKLSGRLIDPYNEILVTSGAMEAVFATIQGHVDDGDEVIIIEPFYDSYAPVVKMAGGVVRHLQLKLLSCWNDGVVCSSDYVLDDTELESAFNEKTKMIILNTPNNPLGKVYSKRELEKIADLCHKYNVLCVSDEVYEWIVYDNNEHVRIGSLPGMWERTITIGSAGKAFSVTGWRIGWLYGPANLIANMQLVHARNILASPTPLQEALAIVFEEELKLFGTPKSFFQLMSTELRAKRDFMLEELRAIGMRVVVPQAGYFIIADWTDLASKIDLPNDPDEPQDCRFAKWMVKNVGILGIPPSSFLSERNKHAFKTSIRLCFFKKDKSLEKAAVALQNWGNKMRSMNK